MFVIGRNTSSTATNTGSSLRFGRPLSFQSSCSINTSGAAGLEQKAHRDPYKTRCSSREADIAVHLTTDNDEDSLCVNVNGHPTVSTSWTSSRQMLIQR